MTAAGRVRAIAIVLFLALASNLVAQAPPITAATLFSTTDVPVVLNSNAGTPLEVGMKFTSDRDGFISGVRFYKGASNVGTHVGSLWSSTGVLMAQAVFTGETASGWQQVSFASPVAITANTVYVVSYHGSGYYSYDMGYFNYPVDNPPLHAVFNSVSANGVFGYSVSSIFPTLGASGSNFWVDAVFTTVAPPTLTAIAVTPVNPSISVGETLQLHAIGSYSDSTNRDLTGQVNWNSAVSTVATIGGTGLASAAGVGTTAISATLNGIGGGTTLTVIANNPPPSPHGGHTLFSTTTTPDVADANVGSPVELGIRFTSDEPGFVTGVRFYKGVSNTGVHIGSLWTNDGNLLARVTFAAESESGWQQADFSNPVPVLANTPYIISYHSTGGFSYTLGYFTTAFDNPPLHAPAGGNGLYSLSTSSAFPAITTMANFWVDVVFSAGDQSLPLVSIAVTPVDPSVTAGSILQFRAQGTYSDNSTQDITSQVTWSSSQPTVAIINTAGLAAANTPGTSVITATKGGASGTTTLSVTPQVNPPPSTGTFSVFPDTAIPGTLDGSAGQAVELGMKFSSEINGYVTGVRFYKGPSNLGLHTGSLWTADGQLLARVTFTGETAAGWQQANFAEPIAIAANTVYVISYHSVGSFSYSVGYFNAPVDNPPLHAPASGNGLYSFAANSSFPLLSTRTNFYVDVVFTNAISNASLVSIAVTPANPTIGVGQTQQFQAIGTYSDNSTPDISGQVTWSSTMEAVATISATGLARGIMVGTSSITATLGTISGVTGINVTATPPEPPAAQYTLFDSSAQPAILNSTAGQPIEVGMKFTAERDGFITGVRFFKGTGNQGTHVGSMWSSTGQLLAQATFAGESASGWQQVNFPSKVRITANTVYIVSYHSTGYYSYDPGYFNNPVDNAPLHGVWNGTSLNGVYSYSTNSTFPSSGAAGANFWVDVVFE